MLILIIICMVLLLGYIALMLLYHKGWCIQTEFILPENNNSHTFISVIIPARNEAANIDACIRSLLAQDYPKDLYEIIVVDDHSTDATPEIVLSHGGDNVHYIRLADHIQENEVITAYKKKAISVGIKNSKGDFIITTDADCISLPHWLKYMAAFYESQKSIMVIAPVDFTCNNTTVELFQSIDFMGMQGITAAANSLKLGNMSNGANLGFNKEAYNFVNGYDGIDHLASGDDYLLMMKLQKAFPGRINYLKSKNTIVTTVPQPTWKAFLQQRIRWASKSGKYDDKRLTAVLLFVYLFNLSFLILLIAAFFKSALFIVLGVMLLCKILTELYFAIPVARFFNKTAQIKKGQLLQPLHIAYIILAGFLGFVGVYQWKGRKTK